MADTNSEHTLALTTDLEAERRGTIKSLFPDLFSADGELNASELRRLFDVGFDDPERYEIRWQGKADAKRVAFAPTSAALKLDLARSVITANERGNAIIEGENLAALKLLLPAYRNSIRCIYADPPYNGGSDQVYSDTYSQDRVAYWEQSGSVANGVRLESNPESGGRFHSRWMSMLYSRLLVSRLLLAQDGVVFISIGDDELANLLRILDEVFGQENFVGTIVWKNVTDNNPTLINSDHEYIVCYARDVSKLPQSWKSPDSDAKDLMTLEYERLKSSGLGLDDIQLGMRRFINDNKESVGALKRYKFVDDVDVYTESESVHNTRRGGYEFELLHPVTNRPMRMPVNGYRYPEATIRQMDAEGAILYGDDENGIVKIKKYLHDYEDSLRSVITMDGRLGSYDLMRIFETKVFDNPKPVNLLGYILGFVTSGNDIVLDLFAGSGSTLQAVWELNRRDGGKRHVIAIQIPEIIPDDSETGRSARSAGFRTISDITIERARRVSEGYGKNPQPLAEGFRVYQMTRSAFALPTFQPDPDKSDEDNSERLRQYLRERNEILELPFEPVDVLAEVVMKNGFTLDYQSTPLPDFTNNHVFEVDSEAARAIVCVDQVLHAQTVTMLCAMPDSLVICLETALDTSAKWNLRQHLGDKFRPF